MHRPPWLQRCVAIALGFCLGGAFTTTIVGCGGNSGANASTGGSANTITSVAVSCNPTTITTDQTTQCGAVVSGQGNPSQSVTWSISPASAGSLTTSNGVFTPSSTITATTTVTVTATSTVPGYTNVSGSAKVTVNPSASPPTVSLSASPTTILLGSATTLTWSSTNASSCTASGSWTGTQATSGTQSETPTATGTASYTLACTGAGGTASATANVTVNPPAAPTVSLSASPTTILLGSATTLTWSSTNATSCTASRSWTGTQATSGTQSETPTATGTASYTLACTGAGGTASATANVTVNPATPQITALTPRYIVSDSSLQNISSTPTYTIGCSGCESGDILHDASGLLPDFPPMSLSSGQTSFGIIVQWQPGTYQPWFLNFEIQHPGGAYGNQWATAFLGSASQSTLAVSPKTGTLLQVEQQDGQVHWQKTDGSTGTWFSNPASASPSDIAIDNVTGDAVDLTTGTTTLSPSIGVYTETGNWVCSINKPAGMSFVSSIAAAGGYMVFTDPKDNLIGIAKMDCSGYTTVSVKGQPWSVAVTDASSGTYAYILARDAWGSSGSPGLIKLVVPTGTVAGSVELQSIPTVTSIRSANPTEGVYQVVAFQNSPLAGVLYMSDSSDGKVLLVSTDTSSGKTMAVTQTVPVAELPFQLATQETTSSSTLWVASINASSGDAVTQLGTIDPTTGTYTPGVKTCPTGILAGGLVATSTQVYCAQGSVIQPAQ